MREISIAPSSHIQSVIYDDDEMLLTITFQKGKVYTYKQVPGDVADGFSQAELSAHDYFVSFVKGQFDYERMN